MRFARQHAATLSAAAPRSGGSHAGGVVDREIAATRASTCPTPARWCRTRSSTSSALRVGLVGSARRTSPQRRSGAGGVMALQCASGRTARARPKVGLLPVPTAATSSPTAATSSGPAASSSTDRSNGVSPKPVATSSSVDGPPRSCAASAARARASSVCSPRRWHRSTSSSARTASRAVVARSGPTPAVTAGSAEVRTSGRPSSWAGSRHRRRQDARSSRRTGSRRGSRRRWRPAGRPHPGSGPPA